MPDVFLSVEAQKKMLARGVTFEEVEYATLHPDVTWKNRSRLGRTYDVHQCGDIAVVVKPLGKDWQVVSVLWRNKEQWTDGQMFIDRVLYQEPKTQRVTR